MKDRECIEFLQWALPKLEMRWPGFRKVRRQVCSRVKRRIAELELSDSSAYSRYLETHPEEWDRLDSFCRITISRFYRDRGVFGIVEDLLCELGRDAEERGEKVIHCWSAGCASGEEPYTLALIWEVRLKSSFPELELRITASDSDPNMIRRGKTGCYGRDSMKDLPEDLLEAGFDRSGEQLCIKDSLKRETTFLKQDIRETMPEGPFQLILCRYLVFTYYDEALQRKILERLAKSLVPGGMLVTGIHETLPVGTKNLFVPEAAQRGIYRRCLKSQVMESMRESISIEKLIGATGGRFSSELGIDLTGGDQIEIFKWFLASKLFGARISSHIAIRTYREFEARGITTAKAIREIGWDGLVDILDSGGFARYDFSTATKLLSIMNDLEKDYGGDLNQLHDHSQDEEALERRLKGLGKGIGDITVNIFLRELRNVWEKAEPQPSGFVRLAAKNLGLLRPCENAMKALKEVWGREKVRGMGFCDFEAALLRLGKDYCKRSKCDVCPVEAECKRDGD